MNEDIFNEGVTFLLIFFFFVVAKHFVFFYLIFFLAAILTFTFICMIFNGFHI